MKTTTKQQYGDIELGKRLRKLRLARGLTQADLAEPKYTHAHVSTIEAGRRMPSEDALEFFAQKLGVDSDELATGRPAGVAAELRVRVEQARAGISEGHLDAAKKSTQSVIKEAREFRLPRVEARAHEVLALALERSGDFEGAVRSYEKAVGILKSEAPTAWAGAIAGQLRCLDQQQDPHQAIFIGENYLERLKQTRMSSPAALLRVTTALILPYLHSGSLVRARESADRCQQLIPRVNDPFNLAVSYVNIAAVQLERGLHADANISLAKAEELFETQDLTSEAGMALLARGVNLARDGKDEAKSVLERASSALAKAGHRVQQSLAELELGRLERLAGQFQNAVVRIEQALRLLAPGAQPRLEAWGRRELGLALAAIKDKRAEKELGKAIELYRSQKLHQEVARTYVTMARLHPATSKLRLKALEQAADAIEQVTDL